MLMPERRLRGPHPLTILDLATFVVAADAPDLATAAEVAGLTPSALMRRLHRLETRVDVQLFDHRRPSALVLTTSGRRMEPLARGALERLQELERFATTSHTSTTTDAR